jgi:para-aminobenzoate synthetase/4-amino-4-deoxychorismate lyase
LLAFFRPERVLEARRADEVRPALAAADAALARGRFVAGYLAYEAAAAFGLRVRPPGPDGPPLLWLGVFAAPAEVEAPPHPEAAEPAVFEPRLTPAAYAAAVAAIQERIGRGDTYQVNFTFALESRTLEDPFSLFARLLAVQPAPHAAFLDLGRFAVASASPELLFEREGTLLRSRPMKGTAPRGADLEDDARAAAALEASAKDRAENLMILDMLRNDLGRVAEIGSVRVPALFEVERYPTLLQMTSTVEAQSAAPLSEVMAALFPCASVTGAPKARTMEIIAELEAEPRGVYTGALGWAGPQSARFAVAIRTVTADRRRGTLRYGVGSGVVADSRAEDEYAECRLKARVLQERPFELLETLAFHPGEGWRRLEGHLLRLRRAASYFAVPLGEAPEEALSSLALRLEAPTRVRLLVDLRGRVRLEASRLPSPLAAPVRVGLAARPVSGEIAFLRHKTTRREAYEEALRSRPDCEDVLLYNERGELTESAVANVAVPREGGLLVTPAIGCGLLPGVERAALLAEGRLREAVVRAGDLVPGERLFLLNSVRGLYEAAFVG